MPQVQYPFIDIAVHPAVRARFAAGDAMALFSRDMERILWANGEGAAMFGHADIYDLLDNGPDRTAVSFRQLAATARQLREIGDRRRLTMRVGNGFTSQPISAEVSLVEIRQGDVVVIFSAPVAGNAASREARIAAMLKGFDDPDTHMAVVDQDGAVLASSDGYRTLAIVPETARALAQAANRSADGLIKRPIATGAGYLPAAIGKLSAEPPLYLLFCVETMLGRMDAPLDADPEHDEDPTAGDAAADVASAEADIGTELQADQAEASDEESGIPPADAEPDAAELLTTPPEDFVEAVAAEHAIEEAGSVTATDESITPAAEEEASGNAADEAEAPFAYESESASTVEAEAEPDTALESDEITVPHLIDVAAYAEATMNDGENADDIADLSALDQPADDHADDDADHTPAADMQEVEASEVYDESGAETDRNDVETQQIGETDASEDASMEEPVDAKTEDMEDPVADGDETPVPEPGGFIFRREGRPVRFVWKLDAEGRFCEVSEEFARTVGPHAGDINGKSFPELAERFNLDPDGEIRTLLDRRDTWSGRTIRWPVEGSDLVVPVDLAALPTYSRNREFDGFRGFGIIRVADAERDPSARGLGLTGDTASTPEPSEEEEPDQPDETETPVPVEPTGENTPDTGAVHLEALPADKEEESGTPAPQDDFRGEVPVISVASNPLATFSEKVIQLEERRTRNREGLTQSEQAAFHEIARQLEPFGKRPNDVLNGSAKTEDHAEEDTRPDEDAVAGVNMDAIAAAPEPADAAEDMTPPEPDTLPELPEASADDFPAESEVRDGPEMAEADAGTDEADAGEHAENEPADEDEVEDIGLTASVAEQLPLAILIHAGDRLIHANSEFMRMSGDDSLDTLAARGGLDALIARREGPDGGVFMIRADGTHVPVNARLQSVRYEGARLLMLTLAPVEIRTAAPETAIEDHEAARKLAALKVEAEELRSILETATDGVVVLDTDGRIRSLNRSASALFNYEDMETRGRPFAMLFAHESQKAVQDYLAGLQGHGVASVLNDGREVIGREASGGFIPLFMTMGRMPGSNSYCAVIRDITQWKRSEEELKTAKRAAETANQHKSDFLARVSHEIRTPLNAIIGFADMIASEHFGPAGHPRYVEYANDIGRSGRHVLDIVNDLLDISKIEAGEMDLEFAAVNINDCVSEAVSLVQPQANAQRVIIRTSLSQSVPDVVADLRSIKQIAINILANAIRFTPSGGQIVVSTAYEPNGSVMLRIRDTGVGMSKSELEQAMKPFGQVSPGSRARGDGTGLGLPLTRAMTEANRATFSIQSAPNEGTLVEITFPPQRVLAD